MDSLFSDIRFLHNSRFRGDAAAFLALEAAHLTALRTAIDSAGTFDLSFSQVRLLEAEMGLEEGKALAMVTMASIIYSRQRELNASDDELRNMLTALASDLDAESLLEEKLVKLVGIFEPIDSVERADARRRATQAMPALQFAKFWPELRLALDTRGGETGLVPLILGRLEFDEAIAGQQGIAFQLEESMLDGVLRELTLARDRLREMKGRFSAHIAEGAALDNSDDAAG